MEQNRDEAEERLQAAIREQSKRADANEMLLIVVGGLLAVVLVGGLLLVLLRRGMQPAGAPRAPVLSRSGGSPTTEASEYVLDGRDEDGIRYLLRISCDQLADDAGVVIGRNPKHSPYIINHSDVSRKHARMRVVQSKVFIEDLGSTNGTLVNGSGNRRQRSRDGHARRPDYDRVRGHEAARAGPVVGPASRRHPPRFGGNRIRPSVAPSPVRVV